MPMSFRRKWIPEGWDCAFTRCPIGEVCSFTNWWVVKARELESSTRCWVYFNRECLNFLWKQLTSLLGGDPFSKSFMVVPFSTSMLCRESENTTSRRKRGGILVSKTDSVRLFGKAWFHYATLKFCKCVAFVLLFLSSFLIIRILLPPLFRRVHTGAALLHSDGIYASWQSA